MREGGTGAPISLYISRDLWRSDGTDAGTYRLVDIYPGPFPGLSTTIVPVNEQAAFLADDGSFGRELWCSDGTLQGTRMVRDLVPGFRGLADSSNYYPYLQRIGTLGNQSVLQLEHPDSGIELYLSDCNSLTLIRDLNPNGSGSDFRGGVVSGGRIVFAGDDGVGGVEPWISDGSAAGTHLLSELRIGTDGSEPHDFRVGANGTLLFSARLSSSVVVMMRTDGTPAGTMEVWRMPGGGQSSVFSIEGPMEFPALAGARVVFSAGDGVSTHVYQSDGSFSGTTVLAQNTVLYSPNFAPVATRVANGQLLRTYAQRLLFSNGDPTQNHVVMETQGDSTSNAGLAGAFGQSVMAEAYLGAGSDTIFGTARPGPWRRLRPLLPAAALNEPYLRPVTPTGGLISVQLPVTGTEPWYFDAITETARSLGDLNPGLADTFLGLAFPYGAGLIAGVRQADTTVRLLVSDGTPAGSEVRHTGCAETGAGPFESQDPIVLGGIASSSPASCPCWGPSPGSTTFRRERPRCWPT